MMIVEPVLDRYWRQRPTTAASAAVLRDRLQAERGDVARLIDRLQAELDALAADGTRSRHKNDSLDCLRHDIRALRDGVSNGAHSPTVALRHGRPGLRELDALIAYFDQLTRELTREPQVWPRSFRYVGPAGKAEHEGRLLKPGDVVQLTRAQVESWADRFEQA
jgi:hypothetical protein